MRLWHIDKLVCKVTEIHLTKTFWICRRKKSKLKARNLWKKHFKPQLQPHCSSTTWARTSRRQQAVPPRRFRWRASTRPRNSPRGSWAPSRPSLAASLCSVEWELRVQCRSVWADTEWVNQLAAVTLLWISAIMPGSVQWKYLLTMQVG